MKTIRWTASFKGDFKRIYKSSRHRDQLHVLDEIGARLVRDQALESRFNDHPLLGKWKGARECHLSPDLLLIYRLEDDAVVAFVRLGTHSELFG